MLARVFRRPASTYSRKVTTAAATRETPRVSVKKSVVVVAVAAASLATLYYQSQQKKASAAQQTALDSKNFVDLKVSKVTDVNHNTKIITLALEEGQKLGLPVASCVVVKLNGVNGDDGKPIIRPYTPLDGESVGFSELLIKKYPDGKLTPHLHSLKPGDKISVKGPISKFPYQANSKKHIGLIAGGSGITPMLQVADAILSNPEDKTEVSFVFANIAEEDILLRKELDARATKHKNFKVHYVLEKAPKDWKGSIGYVTKDVIQKHIHAPSNDSLVMVCGPPAMMKAISGSKAPDYTQGELDGVLKTMGYTKEQVFKF